MYTNLLWAKVDKEVSANVVCINNDMTLESDAPQYRTFDEKTRTLTIKGTFAANLSDYKDEFEEDIYFSEVSDITYSNDKTAGATAVLDDSDKGTITINAGTLTNVGDYIEVTYTIKSESDLAVKVTLDEFTSPDHFTVTTDWTAGQAVDFAAGGAEKTVTVKVQLTKTPDEDISENITLTFDATT
jgi:hypothetical protein